MTCYDKALDLLARRAHFTAELEAKLTQRGFGAEEVAASLARLVRDGYLDDLQTARGFVAERRRRNAWAGPRLRAELLRRGVPGEVASAAVEELEEDGDWELAREVAERWRRRRGGDRPQALARHLERKGFPPRVILRLVREAPDQG